MEGRGLRLTHLEEPKEVSNDMSKGSSLGRGVLYPAWRGVKEALYSKVVCLLRVWIIDSTVEREGLEAQRVHVRGARVAKEVEY
jgi:hypothetical protein